MHPIEVVTRAPDDTRALGRRLGATLEAGDVLLLVGDLGAGKTQLAKGIAEGLGVEETVVSPTFTLAREYRGRLPMVHVDVYRLDRSHELLDLGLDDVGDDVVTVVEWGDVAQAHLPADHVEVRFALGDGDDDERAITVSVHGVGWVDRVDALTRAVTGAGGSA